MQQVKKQETLIDGFMQNELKIPSNRNNNYSKELIQERQAYIKEEYGTELNHSACYSFEPESVKGNIENFTGIAQVPMGVIGPLHVRGEQAQGYFPIPMCTTEGTLLASYNRGIKILNLSGGAVSCVLKDQMQRAPVFTFESALDGKNFVAWIRKHYDIIKMHAESTSSVAKLQSIEDFQHNKFVHLRFNYYTGDAAGQNMVSMGTYMACSYINQTYKGIKNFILEGNFATDKKSSYTNSLLTRGKRVTSEILIPKNIVKGHMRTMPEVFAYNQRLASLGAYSAGSNNNGGHSANGITAMFIATGQDVANIAESSASICYSEVTPMGDLYVSITIPSLIVATFGGGTGLATQKECLDMMNCYGNGNVCKLAEIIAGVALAGELSILSAMCTTSSHEFVMAHERYGRNRNLKNN